jgi:hypothetical protein
MVGVEHCVSDSGRKPAACAPLFRTERVFAVYPVDGGGNLPSPSGRADCSLFLLPTVVVGWCTSWFWSADRMSFEEMWEFWVCSG